MHGVQTILLFVVRKNVNGFSEVFSDTFIQFLFFIIYAILCASALGDASTKFCLCYIKGNNEMNSGSIVFHKFIQHFCLRNSPGKTVEQKSFCLRVFIELLL